MTDFCEIHRQDWSNYVLGTLDPSERAEMSAHLNSGCLECAKRFAAAQAAVISPEPEDDAQNLLRPVDSRLAAPYSPQQRWKFWSVAPWVLAALFFGLFVVAERSRLNLQKQMLDARQMNPVTNHIVHETRPAPPGNGANAENDEDLQATIEQLRGSLDQANQQVADAQRDTVRFQTDLKTDELQIAAQQSSLRDSEERRVRAEADAASIRMQLAKAQDDAHRAALLSTQNEQMVKLLESPQLHQLPLKVASAAAGDATARIVWDNERGLMLIAHGLPELADDHVYRLWIFRKSQPSMANAGVVQVDSRGRGVAYLAPAEVSNDMAGAVVTDEPSAAGLTPRGSQILLGKF